MARERLPNRRECETVEFSHGGADFTMTAGCYPGGKIGEIFVNAGHANSALDALASDAAIAVSFALQTRRRSCDHAQRHEAQQPRPNLPRQSARRSIASRLYHEHQRNCRICNLPFIPDHHNTRFAPRFVRPGQRHQGAKNG